MTARTRTGLADFLGRVTPVLKPVSSSETQRGNARQPSSLQQPMGMGRVFRTLHVIRPTISLPLVACPGYATCTYRRSGPALLGCHHQSAE